MDEEYRIRRKDGDWIWVHVRSLGTHLEDGIPYADGILSDITRRKQAETELRLAQFSVEHASDDVHWVDAQGRIVYVNQAACHSLGFTREELLSKSIWDIDPLSPKDAWGTFWEELKTRGSITFEAQQKTKQGGVFPAEITANYLNFDGQEYSFAFARDITARKRAEDELYRSRQMLQSILDAIPQRVFWKDRNCIYTGCNRAFAADAGLDSPAAIIGKSDFDLAWASTADLYRTDDQLVMGQGSSKLNFEERQSIPDGSLLWLQTNKLPLRDRDGKVTGVIGTYEDITARKRAEEEVRESNELVKLVLDSVPEAVYGIDMQGKCTFCNPACLRILGYGQSADLYGRDMHAVLHHSRADGTPYPVEECHIYEAFRRGQGTHIDDEVLWRRDGTSFSAEYWSQPIHRDGKVVGTVVTFMNIAERKRAETELRMAQFSMEHASDAIFRVDPEGRILYVNGQASHSCERSREELLSLTIPDIAPIFPREAWVAFWKDIKVRGAITLETLQSTKQGRVFPVEVTANYLKLDGQEYVFSFVRDLTERRKLEGQLRHAQKLEGIGQLAAGIAHEINTPTQFVTDNLTFLRDSWKAIFELLERYRGAIQHAGEVLGPGVIAGLEQAERDCDLEFITAEAPRAIVQSLDGAGRVAKIVRAMKEFSHPDSVDKTAADLNRAIESTITVARNEWKYVAEIETKFDETLPPVICYPGDINQVILNLVVNAAHAIHERFKDGEMGRITVSTRTRGEFAEIAITDTGTGVPDGIRNRIFDPFFTTKDVGKGTGQGLAFAHTVIVKKHAGKIWFETEMGCGTTFFINLPIGPASPEKEI